MQRASNAPTKFLIANYKQMAALILRLKATGLEQENFVETDFLFDSHYEHTTGVWLNTESTVFTVRTSDCTTTLYLGEHAICKTTNKSRRKYFEDRPDVNFIESITSIIDLNPLTDILLPDDPNTQYNYFLTGSDKPSELQMKHLSYLGLDVNGLVFEQDQLWYIKIPKVSLFEIEFTREYHHGKYVKLLYCREDVAGTHVKKCKPIKYDFFIHTFMLPRVANIQLVFESPIEIKKHYSGGMEFIGTIEAFSRALANKEIYSIFTLESKAADYSDVPLDIENAKLFYKTILNNPDLKYINLSEITLSGEGQLLILRAIRSLPNFVELTYSNIRLEPKISFSLMVKMNKLFIDIPTKFYYWESNEACMNFRNLSELIKFNREQEQPTYFATLPKSLLLNINNFFFFDPAKHKLETPPSLKAEPSL